MKNLTNISISIVIIIIGLFTACTSDSPSKYVDNTPKDSSFKMTFVELGSDNCDPCIRMRPVMDSIQAKYGSQIIVKFIDVLKNPEEGEPFKIKLMPTQVFLDTNNIEVFRHLGFFPEDSLHRFLQSKGLKILTD